jgi:ABC-2 type transport system ATP-binding protein
MVATIALRNIGKQYSAEWVLSNITMGVEKGSFQAIIGPPGSGKSTLLNIISTLIQPETGTAYVHGLHLQVRYNQVRSLIGYLGQTEVLDYRMTLIENLQYAGLIYGLDDNFAKSRISELGVRFQIIEQLKKYPDKVSHGTRRIVEFIRTILHNPSVILLDNPTQHMDSFNSEKVWSYLNELRHDKTLIFISKNLERIQSIADRILILNEGQIATEGTLEQMKQTFHLANVTELQLDKIEDNDINELKGLSGIHNIDYNDDTFYLHLKSDENPSKVLSLFDASRVKKFIRRDIKLEDIYAHLIEESIIDD